MNQHSERPHDPNPTRKPRHRPGTSPASERREDRPAASAPAAARPPAPTVPAPRTPLSAPRPEPSAPPRKPLRPDAGSHRATGSRHPARTEHPEAPRPGDPATDLSLPANLFLPRGPVPYAPTTDASAPAATTPPEAATPDGTAPEGDHTTHAGPETEQQVTLRDAADLADALPYLMGFYPDDSIVLVGLHGPRGRFGARVRLGIPADPEQWPDVADQLASCLISAADDRGDRPAGMLVFLCQEPAKGERGQDVTQRLRPLAQRLRTACGALDVPVLEALCLSNNRYWSYCCPDYRCCPADGKPMVMPGTSVMAAAAAYAGMQVRGSLKEMEARLTPRTGPRAAEQVKALDTAVSRFLPRMLHANGAHVVRQDTLDRAAAMIHRFRLDTPAGSNRARDACDDALLTDAEAAELILGLQDRLTRDRAAEWMEGPSAAAALRVWRALARRCAGAYLEHSVAPLTLAGWVAWSTDDQPSARVALSRALGIDPDYVFAQLLHRGINEGLDPEPLRRCLRSEREERAAAAARTTSGPRGAEAAARTAPAPDTTPAPDRTPRSRHAPSGRPATPRGSSGPPGTRPAARRTRRGGNRSRR